MSLSVVMWSYWLATSSTSAEVDVIWYVTFVSLQQMFPRQSATPGAGARISLAMLPGVSSIGFPFARSVWYSVDL